MFDRHYCIKTQCYVQKPEIFEENELENLYFLWLKARENGTFAACVLKMPLPGQIPTSCWRHVFTFATMHVTDSDVTFCDGPGMVTIKAAKQVYNSTWIDLLKHGFVLVKTWLLIACGTRFYAIIIICNHAQTHPRRLAETLTFHPSPPWLFSFTFLFGFFVGADGSGVWYW